MFRRFIMHKKTDKPSFTFLVGAVECSIPLSENLDLGEEKTKTEEELKYLKGFLISVEKKLSNEKIHGWSSTTSCR